MPRARVNIERTLCAALLLLAISCSTYKGIETRPGMDTGKQGDEAKGDLVKVKRLELFGFAVHDNQEQIYTDDQLDQLNNQTIADAKAEAEAKQILFNINRKEQREKIKQDTSKFLSWICFAGALGAIAMGVATQGYKRWATLAAALFAVGMVGMILPDLVDILKWVLIGLGSLGIILGMSHTREWSLFNRQTTRSGSQSETTKG